MTKSTETEPTDPKSRDLQPSDPKRETKSDPDKKTGKFHYDPVGMAGQEAGKVKEIREAEEEQQQSGGQGEDGDRLGRKT